MHSRTSASSWRSAGSASTQMLKHKGVVVRPKPVFGHESVAALPNGQTLIGCYHPSRQNTNTGRLTPRMMDAVFRTAARQLARACPAATR